MDKSPYSEIYYQKTPSFTEYREKITQEQWQTIEQECLRHKEIIDNAYIFAIQRPVKQCFEKYYKRENEDRIKRGKSYETLNEQRYTEMYNSFYTNIPKMYEDNNKGITYITEDFDQKIDIKNITQKFI